MLGGGARLTEHNNMAVMHVIHIVAWHDVTQYAVEGRNYEAMHQLACWWGCKIYAHKSMVYEYECNSNMCMIDHRGFEGGWF